MKLDIFDINLKRNRVVLALGPESSGNFSIYARGKIYFYQTGLDLFDENNFVLFKKSVLGFLRKKKMKPDIILADLHPRYRTTVWGGILAQKFRAKNIQVQHHVAHVFSSVGDRIIHDALYKIPNTFYGVVCDGTGYGIDGKIWGGEILKISNSPNCLISNKRASTECKIERIGHLENQILIGGDLVVREPARMLISIFDRFMDKERVYKFVKKYYSRNQFELLHNQLKTGFNCLETSSTARILDAVSVLLGFSKNIRGQKHGPTLALEKNSTAPYKIKPKIIYDSAEKNRILLTIPLYEFLLKNSGKDKRMLAATAQYYIARGLHEILGKYQMPNTFFSGGMADNKIMSAHFSSQGFYLSKKIPRGDAGMSFGQIIYYLMGFSKSSE